MFDAAKPIANMSASAVNGVGEIISKRIVTRVAIPDPIKNFFEDSLVKSNAPINVPNILPKK